MSPPIQKFAGRIAVAVLLVMLAAGSVFATAATLPATAGQSLAEPAETESPEAKESPDTDEDADGTPSAANLARIVERLHAAGITTDSGALAALAAKVGVGGAIRVLRFAAASGKTSAEILALFESGKGWGVIARELAGDPKFTIGPGNGSVMGKGHGQNTAAKAADRAARAEAKAARAAVRAARAAERAQGGAGSGD